MGFVRKVYSLVAAQLVLTTAIAAPIYNLGEEWMIANQWLYWLALVALVCTMCAMMCCQEALRSFPINYFFLLVITGTMSVLVGFDSVQYTWQSVLLAAGITAAIFVAMTILAWVIEIDFTGFGPYLYAALCTLTIFGFALMIMACCGVNIDMALMFYDACGVLLFTFYIVYDTQLIIGELGGHKYQFSIDDYAFAALNLYLDIIDLFLFILSLIGDRR